MADAAIRTSEEKARIFVSYSRKDMDFADGLEAALKARGFDVLIDRQEIYAFEDWWKRIEALIGSADTVVFVLSPAAVVSDIALKEVAYAASLNKRLAPVVCHRVADQAVPEQLRRLNYISLDEPTKFEAAADRLAEALQTHIAWIRLHTEFGEAARRWTDAGRASGFLLRPPVLDQAEAWLAFRPRGAPAPTAETEVFISQSRKSVLGTQRLWRAVLASIFVLLVSIILGLIGWIKQDYLIAQWHWWTVTRPYAAAQVWPYVLSEVREQALKPGDSFKECAQDCPELVVVPAGSFTMGSPPTEKDRSDEEGPQHTVTFSRPFAVARYELTFADWDACVAVGGCNGYRPNDERWGRGQQPVITVNWEDARAYVAWLSAVTGKTYRLLSEAEHEYATRAGTTTAYQWGDQIGNSKTVCKGCGSKWDARQPAPVGSFAPNKFGLYDMVGNVFEWTEDCGHRGYNDAPADGSAWLEANGGECDRRVLRGGSWAVTPNLIRSATRLIAPPDPRYNFIGFRVGRTLAR